MGIGTYASIYIKTGGIGVSKGFSFKVLRIYAKGGLAGSFQSISVRSFNSTKDQLKHFKKINPPLDASLQARSLYPFLRFETRYVASSTHNPKTTAPRISYSIATIKLPIHARRKHLGIDPSNVKKVKGIHFILRIPAVIEKTL